MDGVNVINESNRKRWQALLYKNFPTVGIYDVCDLTVRTVTDTYFVGMDKRDKHEYLLGFNTVGEVVFDSKKVALNKVHEAEKHKLNISDETDYEEY